jgi:hypothetical protein
MKNYQTFDNFRLMIQRTQPARVRPDASVRLGRKSYHSHELVRLIGRRVDVFLDKTGISPSACVLRDGEYQAYAKHLPSEVRSLRRLGGRFARRSHGLAKHELKMITAYKLNKHWKVQPLGL